jgi:hypothetical protein
MSFPSFPLQNFRGALSLSLALSLRSRACACSLIVRSLFFLVYNFEGLSGRISSLFCFYPWISHGEFLQKRKLLLLLSTSLHLCFNVFLGRSLFSGLFVVCISFVSRQILLGDCAPPPPLIICFLSYQITQTKMFSVEVAVSLGFGDLGF